MKRRAASSSTNRRSSEGWAVKSNCSSVLVDGNPASRRRPARRRCLAGVVEQSAVQPLGLAAAQVLTGAGDEVPFLELQQQLVPK
jgi:hypothetical protein